MLQWSLVQAFTMALEDSAWYAGVDFDVKKASNTFLRDFFVDLLLEAQKRMQRTQLTPAQIQEAMLARQEKEKALFIQKMDVLSKDDRRMQVIRKQLGIGEWAHSLNYSVLNPEMMELFREQRLAMGYTDPQQTTGALEELPLEAGPNAEEVVDQRDEDE